MLKSRQCKSTPRHSTNETSKAQYTPCSMLYIILHAPKQRCDLQSSYSRFNSCTIDSINENRDRLYRPTSRKIQHKSVVNNIMTSPRAHFTLKVKSIVSSSTFVCRVQKTTQACIEDMSHKYLAMYGKMFDLHIRGKHNLNINSIPQKRFDVLLFPNYFGKIQNSFVLISESLSGHKTRRLATRNFLKAFNCLSFCKGQFHGHKF